MLDVKAGVVNTAPVNMAAPPVAEVYHLKVAPAVVEVAVKTAFCPEVICPPGAFDVTTGATGVGLTITSAFALVELVQPPAVAST